MKKREAEKRELTRAVIASYIDQFGFKYRDLGEYMDMIGLFARKFHVTNDLTKLSSAEDEKYSNVAMARAMLPYEFFEIDFDDANTTQPIPLARKPMSISIERIVVARTHLGADTKDFTRVFRGKNIHISWIGVLISRMRIDSKLAYYGHRIMVMRDENGEDAGAPPAFPLARSGMINRGEDNEGDKFASYGDDEIITAAWEGQAATAKFCELLTHKGVHVRSNEQASIIPRQQRRRLALAMDVDSLSLPEPLPSYRIVIRDGISAKTIERDIAAGRHVRYTPRRRHGVVEHQREYKPGKFSTIPSHIRGGNSVEPGSDYLIAREKLLRGLGIPDSDKAPGR